MQVQAPEQVKVQALQAWQGRALQVAISPLLHSQGTRAGEEAELSLKQASGEAGGGKPLVEGALGGGEPGEGAQGELDLVEVLLVGVTTVVHHRQCSGSGWMRLIGRNCSPADAARRCTRGRPTHTPAGLIGE